MNYLSDPLTTAKFDRTPELRQDRSLRVARLMRGGLSADAAQTTANAEMEDAFYDAVDRLVDDRARTIVGGELRTDGAAVDAATVRLAARCAVISELQALDEVMPYPDLERIAAATAVLGASID